MEESIVDTNHEMFDKLFNEQFIFDNNIKSLNLFGECSDNPMLMIDWNDGTEEILKGKVNILTRVQQLTS